MKIKNEEFKLIIKLKKEFEILSKKVCLYENVIKKIHISNVNDGLKKG
jgi:hypothetical protein